MSLRPINVDLLSYSHSYSLHSKFQNRESCTRICALPIVLYSAITEVSLLVARIVELVAIILINSIGTLVSSNKKFKGDNAIEALKQLPKTLFFLAISPLTMTIGSVIALGCLLCDPKGSIATQSNNSMKAYCQTRLLSETGLSLNEIRIGLNSASSKIHQVILGVFKEEEMVSHLKSLSKPEKLLMRYLFSANAVTSANFLRSEVFTNANLSEEKAKKVTNEFDDYANKTKELLIADALIPFVQAEAQQQAQPTGKKAKPAQNPLTPIESEDLWGLDQAFPIRSEFIASMIIGIDQMNAITQKHIEAAANIVFDRYKARLALNEK